MALATMTITGKTGPGNNLVTVVYNNIISIEVDPDNKALILTDSAGKVYTIDMAAQTTLSLTVATMAGSLV